MKKVLYMCTYTITILYIYIIYVHDIYIYHLQALRPCVFHSQKGSMIPDMRILTLTLVKSEGPLGSSPVVCN